MQSLLIKDTTRAQREEIDRPYIGGEKELAGINAEYAASRGLVK